MYVFNFNLVRPRFLSQTHPFVRAPKVLKLLKVNLPIMSALVPTTMEEMAALGLVDSGFKHRKNSWIYLATSVLLEAINSFIGDRKLKRYIKAKARWPPVVYDHWRQHQMVLIRGGSDHSTSAPTVPNRNAPNAAVQQPEQAAPADPGNGTGRNIGLDAGLARNPVPAAHRADPRATGNRIQPARERFSEYRIDNASSIAELESIRLRLLTLVDRADVRLREMRFAEALIGSFGKETIEELSTHELMDMLSKEIDKSAVTGCRDSVAMKLNLPNEDTNGKRDTSKALEGAQTNDEANKRRHLPATCSLCFEKIASPTSAATCEICEDDGICNKCYVYCSCCHRTTCADCLMRCDGCGSNYHCSDCMAVGGGNCVVCRPKAKNQSNGMPGTASINQGNRTKSRHFNNTTSSLSSGNQMIGLPHYHPPPIHPFPRTIAHPPKIALSTTPHPTNTAMSKQSHATSNPLPLYSIHRFLISEAGTIGINLTKLPQARKCLISTVHNNSVAGHHGIKEGDEILAPRSTSGIDPDVYSLFINATKHRPLLFEVKRPYKPQEHAQNIPAHSLHRFIIKKSGPLGIVLEMENAIVRLKSVTPNSLGDLYGLRNNDILCKPSTNGELQRDSKSVVEAVRSGTRPYIIEVWRALPTLMAETSIKMPEPTSGKNENPFMFSFPSEELTTEEMSSDCASKITAGQVEKMDMVKESSMQVIEKSTDVKNGEVGKEIISIDDDSIDDPRDGRWECDICMTEFDTYDKAAECENKCRGRDDSAEEEKKKDD